MAWPDELYKPRPAPSSEEGFADWLEERFEEKRDAFLRGDMARNSGILEIIVRAIAAHTAKPADLDQAWLDARDAEFDDRWNARMNP